MTIYEAIQALAKYDEPDKEIDNISVIIDGEWVIHE